MFDNLNLSTNVIAFALVLFGGVLALHSPEIGKEIIASAFGMMVGVAASRGPSTPNFPN